MTDPVLVAGGHWFPGIERHVTEADMARFTGRWRTVTGFLLVCGIVGGVVWAVRGQDWSGTRTLVTARTVPYLLAAAGLNVTALLLAMLSWRCLLIDLGHRLAPFAAARVYFLGVTAKYLPGRVWVVLTQIRLAGDLGVGGGTVVTAFLLNIVLVLLAGLSVGALAGPEILGRWGWLLVAPVVGLLAMLVWPNLVPRTATVGARLIRRRPTAPLGDGIGTRMAIGFQLACWLASGLHLWLLAVAAGAPPERSLPVAVGGFALATMLSNVVIVVPDGVAVRELLLATALLSVLSFTDAATVALASRVVSLLTELATAAVVLAAAGAIRRYGRSVRQLSHHPSDLPDSHQDSVTAT
ncbi:MAG TPA: lysylphosphatidylglycerol synthase transmembrane domain-containing protein [Micromonosporaceae bacterium]|nr:lysylphosphatidylglycerol synthase transmembrane domain-containing protein [Micromonosporaceae bacterium]